MKFLRKINKGVALTIIVLFILIIYIVSVEAARSASKPEIEKACKEYIAMINNYAVLPEEAQKLYNPITLSKEESDEVSAQTKKAIETQIDKIQTDLAKKVIDNDLAVKMQKDRIKEFLESENNGTKAFTTKFNKEINKIKKFKFDDDQVTITFSSNVEKEIKYFDSVEEKELSKKGDFSPLEEIMTLQKINGTWKVIYADLQYQDYSATTNMMFY